MTESSTGSSSSFTSTSQSLKVNLYFPVIDHILSEMGRRFSERNLGIMTSVQTCDPTSSHFLEASELKPMASHYGLDDIFLTMSAN